MAETKRRPGTTIEAIEQELISISIDEVKRRILKGTAASQILSIYAREGTVEAQLKRQKLKQEIILLEAKTKAINNAADGKALMDEALKAFKTYSGDTND